MNYIMLPTDFNAQSSQMEIEKLLTVKEVGLRLSISRRTVFRLIEKGKLSSVKLTKNILRIPESSVKKLIIDSTRKI